MLNFKNLRLENRLASFDSNTGIAKVELISSETYTLYSVRLKPNTKLPAEYHKEGFNFVYVVEGSASIHSCPHDKNDDISEDGIQQGDTFMIPSHMVYQIYNDSVNEVCIMLGMEKTHLTYNKVTIPDIVK